MRFSVFKDGNFSPLMQAILIIAGIVVGWAALAVEWIPRVIRLVLVLAGFGSVLVGGFCARAHLIGIKPFERSPWRQAKETYKNEKDEP